jgi:hypothetical protein
MAICTNATEHYIGRAVIFEYAIGCADAIPAEAAFKFAGACNTKGFTLSSDTADATTDQSTGGIRSSAVTYITYEVSVDGKVRKADKAAEANTALLKYYAAEVAAARQPSVWTKMTFPDVTITAYCNLTNYERSAPDSDMTTFSATFSATESDFGVLITDTV